MIDGRVRNRVLLCVVWSALVLAVPSLASAAPTAATWQFAGWDGGGCYPNVAFDPNVKGRIYLTSDVAGAWRSDDNGDSWKFLSEGLPDPLVAQIAVPKSSSFPIYAATGAGVAKMIDAQSAWTRTDNLGGRIKFERPANYRSISIAPNDAGSLCAGTAKGEVFCSNDAGSHWRDLGIPGSRSQPIAALAHTADGNSLIVAAADGIYVHALSTHAWSKADPGLKNLTDLTAAQNGFLAVADGQLWKSGPDGKQWNKSSSISKKLLRVENDSNGSRIYASWEEGWSAGLLVSADDGASWQPLGRSFQFDTKRNPTRVGASLGGRIASLKVSPAPSGSIFYTDYWGVWRSDDAGVTWTEKIAGAPNTVGSDIGFSPDGTLFSATMDNGLLRSADGGKDYTVAFPPPGYSAQLNGHVWRVVMPGNGTVVATSSPWDKNVNQIVLTDVHAETFRVVTSGLPARRPTKNTVWEQGYPRAIAIDPKENTSLYLGIDGDDGGGLFVSRDAGRTWKQSVGQPPARRIYRALAVDPTDTNTLYWGTIGADAGLFQSGDKGQTWRRLNTGGANIFDIEVAPNGHVFAGVDHNGAALLLSTDKGASWKTLRHFTHEGTVNAIAIHPADPRIVAVGTTSWSGNMAQTVQVSYDEGATWLDVTGNLPSSTGTAAMSFTPDGKQLYAARVSGGIYKLDLPASAP